MNKISRGQSIVEMMIGMAMMGLMIAALATINNYISRENAGLREKMAALQVEREIIKTIATLNTATNAKTCFELFAPANLVDSTSLPFDAAAITPATPHFILLKQIPGVGNAEAAMGARANALSETLFVKKATDTPPGIQVAITSVNPPMATIFVNFDQTRLVRAVRNLQFSIKLKLSVPGPATQITDCAK